MFYFSAINGQNLTILRAEGEICILIQDLHFSTCYTSDKYFVQWNSTLRRNVFGIDKIAHYLC